MPEYEDIGNYGGNTIDPLRLPENTGAPSQRGPSCGFYALSYVMGYWHERGKTAEPLPARTVTDESQVREKRRNFLQKGLRNIGAQLGRFTSLRHYGKFHDLTQYGSVFNAEALVRVAEGTSNKQLGGQVIQPKSASQLINSVVALVFHDVPVIIPYDVNGTTGDPLRKGSGKAAHWTTIVGWDQDSMSNIRFLHYMWGSYYRSLGTDFAASCMRLTDNVNLEFAKCEYRIEPLVGDAVLIRDWQSAKNANKILETAVNGRFEFGGLKFIKTSKGKKSAGAKCVTPDRWMGAVLKFKVLDRGNNMEYCDPPMKGSKPDRSQILYPDYYKMSYVNPGLKGKLVAIYPPDHKEDVEDALKV